MRSIVIFRFFSHLPLLFVYQCITFLPLIFRFSLYNPWCLIKLFGVYQIIAFCFNKRQVIYIVFFL